MLVSLEAQRQTGYRGRWFWHAVPGAANALTKAGFAQVFVLKEGVLAGLAKTCLWCAANNLPVVFMMQAVSCN